MHRASHFIQGTGVLLAVLLVALAPASSKEEKPKVLGILFPQATISATRPPIFFAVNRASMPTMYDLQVSAGDRKKDYKRPALGDLTDVIYDADSWIAFNQEALRAPRHLMDAWGVKLPEKLAQSGAQVMYYQPELELEDGTVYSVRARAIGIEDFKPTVSGWCTSVKFSTIKQPQNLEAVEAITNTPSFDELFPSFSSDGKMLLYSTNSAGTGIWEVYSSDVVAAITGRSPVTTRNQRSRDLHPVWGPGNGNVTFARREDPTLGRPGTNLWSVAIPQAVGLTRLTNADEPCVTPAWSPDGRILAYAKDNGKGDYEIWLLENGRNPKVLGVGVDPAWGKDGKSLYYSSNTQGSWDIWMKDVSTGRATQLTSDKGSELHPAVNPVSGDLAYVSTNAGNPDIFWRRTDGVTVQLTHWLGDDIHPAWTPDGERVVYATTRLSKPKNRHFDLVSLDPKPVKP